MSERKKGILRKSIQSMIACVLAITTIDSYKNVKLKNALYKFNLHISLSII